MIQIPNTTLIAVDCLDAERAHLALELCTKGCSFDSVKLLTSKETDSQWCVKIPPIKSLYEYSAFMLKHIHEYCDTLHMQIVQYDGWILNPESWDGSWCQYDYIGSLFDENPITADSVGNGGFSYRSQRLMKFVSQNIGKFDPNYGWHLFFNEDGVITKGMRGILIDAGFKFAPPHEAAKYAVERSLWNVPRKPFGFHSFYALGELKKQCE
jgi:hypothetical protein